ncbi:phosphatidylinositol phosphate synthase [Ornithinicoccus hortensis]|uniref:Phosphatidylinositol phosphate synthase n=1 Tax=Ornithinicoccus hortensis TaxID=82346 RepID=A0A542YTA6_9MICO|nr:CDP-alcohol phosphatidyltransferase family protein [Ornithinicoccus hortensis]TQL51320.1 CDP-diacylglycerol--glycerol-3-phosphate 3-phosphatidyltransferase [Ornithinicoccus hortensis]
MLNRYARAFFTAIFTPIARVLLRLGVSPDAVTLVGTLGVCAGALAFYPRGELWWGTIVITCFVFTDLIDGTMARMSGRTSSWGAFLDSTMDRLGDGAVFGGLILYFTGVGDDDLSAVLALACLVLGFVTSYSKARAEGLGMTADVGIAERADRLVAVLVTTGFVGLFLPTWVLTVVLALLVVAGVITVAQRILTVRQQARAGMP